EVPVGAQVIDLSGRTLIPGLVGMHNHTHMPGNTLMSFSAPRLYLAGGVTTMTTAGSADPIGEFQLASAIDAGEIPGPHIFPSAPYITGQGGNGPMAKPANDEQARAFVNEWADRGATWFKLYRHTDPDIAAAIIDEAHTRGLKVTGHLCSITYREAASMGIDSLEHGLNPASDFVSDKPPGVCVPSREPKSALDPAGPEIGALIDQLVTEGVTLTSTLAILETSFPHRPQADDRTLAAMSPSARDAYGQRQAQLVESAATTSSTSAYWELLLTFERRFVRSGGTLVAGPDTGRHILPGFGDQRNFELLVDAGFSVSETVQIMTHNGAVTLGIGDHVGLIAPGYQADILVVEGNLQDDSSGIRDLRIVFKQGVGFDPDRLIADVQGQVGDQ
ncbi:MAG: amidohydrolase family protein, partial [Paracoccaceae bacterium]